MLAPSPFLIDPFSTSICSMLSKLSSIWSYCTRVYNAANFGDNVSAVRMWIQITKCTILYQPEASCGILSSISLDDGYGKYINDSYNDELVIPTVPLPPDTIQPIDSVPFHPHYLPQTIDEAEVASRYCPSSRILHPDYPAANPMLKDSSLQFGKRFGIPFCWKDGSLKIRAISSSEVILCYSILLTLLQDTTVWLGKDNIIDSLLPDALPYNLASYAA